MNKAVFLDRDGTINFDKEYLFRKEDFEWLPGAIEALKYFQECGYKLIIITNQSGIARGYYTEKDFNELSLWMSRELNKYGITIDKAGTWGPAWTLSFSYPCTTTCHLLLLLGFVSWFGFSFGSRQGLETQPRLASNS